MIDLFKAVKYYHWGLIGVVGYNLTKMVGESVYYRYKQFNPKKAEGYLHVGETDHNLQLLAHATLEELPKAVAPFNLKGPGRRNNFHSWGFDRRADFQKAYDDTLSATAWSIALFAAGAFAAYGIGSCATASSDVGACIDALGANIDRGSLGAIMVVGATAFAYYGQRLIKIPARWVVSPVDYRANFRFRILKNDYTKMANELHERVKRAVVEGSSEEKQHLISLSTHIVRNSPFIQEQVANVAVIDDDKARELVVPLRDAAWRAATL